MIGRDDYRVLVFKQGTHTQLVVVHILRDDREIEAPVQQRFDRPHVPPHR